MRVSRSYIKPHLEPRSNSCIAIFRCARRGRSKVSRLPSTSSGSCQRGILYAPPTTRQVERHFTAEIRPVIGLHLHRVNLIYNPILDHSWAGGFTSHHLVLEEGEAIVAQTESKKRTESAILICAWLQPQTKYRFISVNCRRTAPAVPFTPAKF